MTPIAFLSHLLFAALLFAVLGVLALAGVTLP